MKSMRVRSLTAVLPFLACMTAGQIHAGLLVSEGFNYPATTPVYGQSGGTGWTSPWSDYSGGAFITTSAASLSYGTLPTSGGAASSAVVTGSPFSYLVRGLPSTAASSIYVSFLLRRDEDTAANYGGINLLASGDSVFIGKSGTTSTLGLESTPGIESTSTTLATGSTYFLLAQVEFGAAGGKDRISLYVNPAVDGTIPASPDAVRTDLALGAAQYVYLNNSGGWTTDEIRVGTSWAAVIPEPQAWTWVLGGIALLAPLARRLRQP